MCQRLRTLGLCHPGGRHGGVCPECTLPGEEPSQEGQGGALSSPLGITRRPQPGTTDAEQGLYTDPSASTAQEGAGHPQSARAASPRSEKKKKIQLLTLRKMGSHEKEKVPERGPRHPHYSQTAVWGKSPKSSRSCSWLCPCEQGSTVGHRKSWVSGRFQPSPGLAPSPSHSPP